MKASELRIGNWILPSQRKWPNLPPFQVKVIELENKEIGEPTANEHALSDELDPIPLTEEWLVKFGFTNIKGVYCDQMELSGGKKYSNNESIISSDGKFYFIRDESTDACDGSTFYAYTEIQHVHQLQNLFFALTGEELTIKE